MSFSSPRHTCVGGSCSFFHLRLVECVLRDTLSRWCDLKTTADFKRLWVKKNPQLSALDSALLGIKLTSLCSIGKHSTKWAVSPTVNLLSSLFSCLLLNCIYYYCVCECSHTWATACREGSDGNVEPCRSWHIYTGSRNWIQVIRLGTKNFNH